MLLQVAQGPDGRGVGPHRFAQIGCLAVGIPVDLVADRLDSTLAVHLAGGLFGPHKDQQGLDVGAGFEINDVDPLAAAAPGRKFVFGQQGLEVPRQVGARGGKFQMIPFLGVGDGAAAQERRPHIGADAAPRADQVRVDLEAGLPAGGAEQRVHLRHLGCLLDLEFVHGAAGVVFLQDPALHAAPREALAGIAGRLRLFGLDDQTPGVKMFCKTGQAVARRPEAGLGVRQPCGDLAPGLGGKAHASSLPYL